MTRLLRQAGVDRLSAVVATHASADHHGGLPEVLERFPVDLLVDGGDGTADPGFRTLLATARARGVPIEAAGAGKRARRTGTPVDCVKLAVDKVLHRKPDLCLSGINHGANHSINVIYSGTMSAAVEAAIESIPSVGFSLLDYSIEADFEPARKYARIIVEKLLSGVQDKHMILNVNIPIG